MGEDQLSMAHYSSPLPELLQSRFSNIGADIERSFQPSRQSFAKYLAQTSEVFAEETRIIQDDGDLLSEFCNEFRLDSPYGLRQKWLSDAADIVSYKRHPSRRKVSRQHSYDVDNQVQLDELGQTVAVGKAVNHSHRYFADGYVVVDPQRYGWIIAWKTQARLRSRRTRDLVIESPASCCHLLARR